MKNITQRLALIALVGGISLHAMDDIAQVNTLENELKKLHQQHTVLEQEFRQWNESMPEVERELEPRFQWLWQEITTLNSQLDELQTQLKQIEQKYQTPDEQNQRTLKQWGIWFRNGTSYK